MEAKCTSFLFGQLKFGSFFLNKQLLDLYVQGNATGITLKFDSIGAAYHNIRYLKWDAKK